MQGPVQPSPGRRAGDPGTSGQDTGGLKEWQRNTWYGPAPLNDGSPFEEPESAPEEPPKKKGFFSKLFGL